MKKNMDECEKNSDKCKDLCEWRANNIKSPYELEHIYKDLGINCPYHSWLNGNYENKITPSGSNKSGLFSEKNPKKFDHIEEFITNEEYDEILKLLKMNPDNEFYFTNTVINELNNMPG